MKKEEATMKKEEPATKKTEAKEEGSAPKHIRVVYSDQRRRIIIFVSTLLLLIIISIFAFSYIATQPRIPQFVLEDLFIDPISNSSVVKLSSTNPSHKTSVYYNKMSLHVQVLGNFETEEVFLGSTRQEPREVTTWTAIVASNNDNVKPTGSFLLRHGMAYGDVIVDILFQWKSGIFPSSKFGLQVRCPVLLRLEDLSSATIKPLSTCSHDFDF